MVVFGWLHVWIAQTGTFNYLTKKMLQMLHQLLLKCRNYCGLAANKLVTTLI